jgi:diacylglycerol kinase (ATP)
MFQYVRARQASFGHAIRGFGFLIRSESHAKVHLLATALVICLGVFLPVSAGEWGLLSLAIGLVWTAEAVNTAVESVVDLCSSEWNEQAGRAKDLAAAAVLIAAVTAFVIGLIVFLPRIFSLF